MHVISLISSKYKSSSSFRTLQKTLIGIAALSSSSPSFFSRHRCEAFHQTTGNSNSGSSRHLHQSTTTTCLDESRRGMLSWDNLREAAVQRVVLPLSPDSYKGSSGRVAVLGGSARYTGAPYYAAMAALQAGADLAYVFTATEAALPIKTYSPELMVQSVYTAADFDQVVKRQELDSDQALALVQDMVDQVVHELDRLHCLVIGPGMGRCPLVMKAVAQILVAARIRNVHVVLDADALFMLSLPEYRHILSGYSKAVLTPNVVEYKRLFPTSASNAEEMVKSAHLKHVTIVRKGKEDVVVVVQDDDDDKNDATHMICFEPGGLKRSGGIGDVLAGTLGTTLAWHSILVQRGVASADDLPLSCWTACCFVKRATYTAFQEKRRSMTAPDVMQALGPSIDQMTS